MTGVESLAICCGLEKALDLSSVVRVAIPPCLHQKCRHTCMLKLASITHILYIQLLASSKK